MMSLGLWNSEKLCPFLLTSPEKMFKVSSMRNSFVKILNHYKIYFKLEKSVVLFLKNFHLRQLA